MNVTALDVAQESLQKEPTAAEALQGKAEELVKSYKDLRKAGKNHLGKGIAFGQVIATLASEGPRRKFLITLRKAKGIDEDFPPPSTAYYYVNPLINFLKANHHLPPDSKLKNLSTHREAVAALSPEIIKGFQDTYSSFREFCSAMSGNASKEAATPIEKLDRSTDRLSKQLEELDEAPDTKLADKLQSLATKIRATSPLRYQVEKAIIVLESISQADPALEPINSRLLNVTQKLSPPVGIALLLGELEKHLNQISTAPPECHGQIARVSNLLMSKLGSPGP
jgi:hypothetical protein